jgi:hypothetical protein
MQDKRRWLPSWQRVELAEKVVLEWWPCRQAAAWRHVSISTVSEWARRRRLATAEELLSGAWAQSCRAPLALNRGCQAARSTSVSVRPGHALEGVRPGEPVTHRLRELPGISRRSVALLGPIDSLLVDG